MQMESVIDTIFV